ncbi:hypothetical protein N9B43_07410 [Mariniblastus sp.]|nr:hypothetical protein [Mariniblastus sp.]
MLAEKRHHFIQWIRIRRHRSVATLLVDRDLGFNAVGACHRHPESPQFFVPVQDYPNPRKIGGRWADRTWV